MKERTIMLKLRHCDKVSPLTDRADMEPIDSWRVVSASQMRDWKGCLQKFPAIVNLRVDYFNFARDFHSSWLALEFCDGLRVLPQ
jgi:hypothetical protein